MILPSLTLVAVVGSNNVAVNFSRVLYLMKTNGPFPFGPSFSVLGIRTKTLSPKCSSY